MNLYSHIVIASKLETQVNPANSQEYYWGAAIPDIRYLAAMQRQQTHIPTERILGFVSKYPHLKSFLQGYLVHCLSDEIELEQVFFKHFPFSILKNKMSRQQIAVILELYYFEHDKVSKMPSCSHNEVLSELGVSESQSAKFSNSISQYVTAPSESRFSELPALIGLENDSRIEKYVAAANRFQKRQFLKNALFFGIKAGKISDQIASMVTTLYNQCSL
ncbi:MAG: hypothetical protein HZB50_12980 [Chloroflexi bacterium]|nr:hypothetical protein [Chloroflexota bacterium]